MGGFVHKSHTLNNFWTNELQQAFLLTDLVLLIDITLPPASWFICLNESWTRVRNTNNTVVGRYHISWIVNCISFETGPDTMWRLHNSEWENWLTVDNQGDCFCLPSSWSTASLNDSLSASRKAFASKWNSDVRFLYICILLIINQQQQAILGTSNSIQCWLMHLLLKLFLMRDSLSLLTWLSLSLIARSGGNSTSQCECSGDSFSVLFVSIFNVSHWSTILGGTS